MIQKTKKEDIALFAIFSSQKDAITAQHAIAAS